MQSGTEWEPRDEDAPQEGWDYSPPQGADGQGRLFTGPADRQKVQFTSNFRTAAYEVIARVFSMYDALNKESKGVEECERDLMRLVQDVWEHQPLRMTVPIVKENWSDRARTRRLED